MSKEFLTEVKTVGTLLLLLPQVRKVNWLLFPIFAFSSLNAGIELSVANSSTAIGVPWHESLSMIELIRFYLLIPMAFYTFYLFYRLIINEMGNTLKMDIVIDKTPLWLIDFFRRWKLEKSTK